MQGEARDRITQNLREAIDRLHRDVDNVEIWAGALSAFLQPVPEYDLPHEYTLPSNEDPSAPHNH
jgi:hypothetical protein